MFRESIHTLFGIMADRYQCVILGNLWGVKMFNEYFEFHKNMSQFPHIGYCSSFIHRKLKISNEKNKTNVELYRSRKQKADDYKCFPVPVNVDQLNLPVILRYQKKEIK